jgi:tubulin-specific chaperone E
MASDFIVGTRLSFDGALCTIRYVGEVEGTKGVWLGVEWDDPARGKHNGSHKGRRYFDCKQQTGFYVAVCCADDT